MAGQLWLVGHDSRFREFQGSGTVSSERPRGEAVQRPTTLNAACDAVLHTRRRLTRPEKILICQPNQSFATAGLQETKERFCWKGGTLRCRGFTRGLMNSCQGELR